MTILPDNEDLADEIEAAMWGAYQAAPQGEGVAGAMHFASRAAVLIICEGMKAPEAVAKAIGEGGTYGVPRRYALVPREAPEKVLATMHDRVCILCAPDQRTASIINDTELWKLLIEAAETS